MTKPFIRVKDAKIMSHRTDVRVKVAVRQKQHDFPNDFVVALAIVKKHIAKIEEK